MKAKIDTGARSSALHAFNIEPFERDGAPWVRFSVHPWQRSALDTSVVERPVHDIRHVRSSSGHAQERYVILLDVRILDQVVSAEVTLTHRDAMGFRMLIGREALRGRFVVDSARSYRGGRPEQETRDRNRGVGETPPIGGSAPRRVSTRPDHDTRPTYGRSLDGA